MKFNFKLQKVLSYKKTVENQKKNQYGIIQQKLNREEDKLDNFNRHKNHLENEKQLSAVKTKVGNLVMYNAYINDIMASIKVQENIVAKTKDELEEAKEEMVEALRDKKTFERLKENQYREYLYQLEKQEEKQIDSLISYKASTQQ